MSKAVLISIHPEWCSQIENGLKTIEIRKTRPKISTPFKCYIYCASRVKPFEGGYIGLRKVIGEFVCDRIIETKSGSYSNIPVSESRVDPYDLIDYADKKTVYGWHISDLVIYDKPKELSEFKGRKLVWRGNNHIHAYETITRPPQSWCYVQKRVFI